MTPREAPPARELFAGVRLARPNSMQGVYVDRGSNNDVRAVFAFQEPDRWSWMLAEEPTAGFVSDGYTHVVAEEGKAVIVTTKGTIGTSNRLHSLLRPRSFDVEGWDLSESAESVELDRPAWLVTATPTSKGKEVMEVAFDQATGIILFMRSERRYLGFEEIKLDEPIPKDVFTWTGPVEERRIGKCFISPDRGDPTCLASWQVSVGGRSVYLRDERFRSKAEAVRWAEKRAAEVVHND